MIGNESIARPLPEVIPLSAGPDAGESVHPSSLSSETLELKLDYDDVLIVPRASALDSRKDAELFTSVEFKGLNSTAFRGVPVMAANMDGVGTFEVADVLRSHGLFTCLAKYYGAKEIADYFSEDPGRTSHCAVTIGVSDGDEEKFKEIAHRLNGALRYACLDVANGYMAHFVDRIREFREEYPGIALIAGNVVTPEQTMVLAEAGADVVKVGIGSGSVCETRTKTGVGYPQLSAVSECAAAARKRGAKIVSDGGCITPGDVAKAFAAGADFVMIGGMLAGHREGGGQLVTKRYRTNEIGSDGEPLIEERQFVEFYGMSSKSANEKHYGGLKDYRASEGRTVQIPLKPSLNETLLDLLGGLRSTCTYVGARNIAELKRRARFVRCHNTHNKVFAGGD